VRSRHTSGCRTSSAGAEAMVAKTEVLVDDAIGAPSVDDVSARQP
jgi:hypothetical protein